VRLQASICAGVRPKSLLMSSTMEAKLVRSATMSTPGIGTAEMPAEIAAACAPAPGSARARARCRRPKGQQRQLAVCVFFLKIFEHRHSPVGFHKPV
jgi:hypothetical protein